MLLYEHPLSSYAQKVKIALREKGVPFELELPESFGTGGADGAFATANPRAEVPVLVDGDIRIFESTIIMEYVEDRWPEPPLLPRTPEARAAARMTEEVCDTQYEAINWGFGEVLWFRRATGALEDKLRRQAARQTHTLQEWLAARRIGSAGRHSAGPMPRSRRWSIARFTTEWALHQGARLPAGIGACPSGLPSPRPSPSSMWRRDEWRQRPSSTRPVAGAANIATIGWNG